MSANSKIEWTDTTWNPTTGCEVASRGCANCYAAVMTKRLAAMGQEAYHGLLGPNGHFNGTLKVHEDRLTVPLSWRKPRRVFVNSMSDLFHPAVPFEFVHKVFAVMALCPQHTFQVLTKRAERMAEYCSRHVSKAHLHVAAGELGYSLRFDNAWMMDWPLSNIWLGVSAEDQEQADKRIPHLLNCPAAIRFVSAEPLLGPIDWSHVANSAGEQYGIQDKVLDWVIFGFESGPKSRRGNIKWIRDGNAQCRTAGIPYLNKQLGRHPYYCDEGHDGGAALYGRRVSCYGEACEHQPIITHPKGADVSEWPEDLRVREFPTVCNVE